MREPQAEAWTIVRPGGWHAVLILGLAYIFSYMDRQLLTLLIEPIRADLGISDTQVSLLAGFAFAICYCIAALPLGRLADIGNRRNIVAAGITVWSLMTVSCGISRSFMQLFIARMGVGVGEAALPPAAYSLIADYFPPGKLALALGVFVIGAPLGGGLALIAGGAVVDLVAQLPTFSFGGAALHPWQVAFVIVGAAGLLVAALSLTVSEPPRLHAGPGSRGEPGSNETFAVADVIRFLRRHKRLFGPLLVGLSFGNIFSYGMLAWLPTFLIRTHEWTLSRAGMSVGILFLTFGCLGPPVGGWIVHALSRRGYHDACVRTILIGFALLLPAAALMPLAQSATAALALMAPIVFGIFMSAGVFPTLLQVITPNRMRGQVSALCLFVVNLAGLGLGPTIYALATDYIFRADHLLRYSLLSVSIVLLAVAATFVLRCIRPYRIVAMEMAGVS